MGKEWMRGVLFVSSLPWKKGVMVMRRIVRAASLVLVIGVCLGWTNLGEGAKGATAILRWTIDWPNRIDPAYAYCFSDLQSVVNLYSPLVYPKPEGGVEPHVAQNWERSEDGLTWTFHLRPGVRFSDGSELEAEDVKFSMERLLAIGAGFSYLFKEKIQDIEILDKYTVRFHLSQPYGPFLAALIKFYIMNKDQVMEHTKYPGKYGDFGDYGEEWVGTHSAGSGPYMVKEFIVTDYLLMERNPYYSFYIAPHAPELVQIIGNIEPATVQTMMRRRDLEISDFWQPIESFDILDSIPYVDIVSFPVARAGFFEINAAKPPTDDVHFRKAICWAFDYETALGLFPGSVQPRGPVPHIVPGWNPNTFQYHRDLGRAREELAQSKYADQLDQYPVEIEYWMPNANNERLALLLQANLAEIGIKSFLSPEPVARALDRAASKETTPHIMFFEIACEYPEAGAILDLHLHSRNQGRYENTHWLEDPELDTLIDRALATVDDEERFRLYYEIQERAVDLALDINIYDRYERHAVQTYYVDWPQSRNPFPATGYNLDARFIEVYPEKRQELVRGGS